MLYHSFIYVALSAFVLYKISINVISERRKNKISFGDDGNRTLMRRIRAQGNFIEYTPIFLISLIGIEWIGYEKNIPYYLIYVHFFGIIFILCFLFYSNLLVGQSYHIFLTYNILNYENEDDREDDYITVLGYVEPDIIIIQEIVGEDGFNHFQSDVLDIFAAGEWSGATFINQSASIDIALFYRHDVFSFISTDLVNTAQSAGTRDVVEWIMEHNDSGVQFNVYGVHLKASSNPPNPQTRLAEATILRDYLNDLPAGSHFIVAGDFNIYSNSSASEPAFEMLTGEGDDDDGRLFDPVDRIGHWHNNGSFADVHTQSPRSGNYGGMDDRFDWIFVSEAVLSETYEINIVIEKRR